MSEVQSTVPAAATTPQQQPQGTPIQQNAPTPASVAGGSGDQLVCQWQNCGDRLPSAEQLYVSRPPSISSDDCISRRDALNFVALSFQLADFILGSRL
jgi:hypothetical protein